MNLSNIVLVSVFLISSVNVYKDTCHNIFFRKEAKPPFTKIQNVTTILSSMLNQNSNQSRNLLIILIVTQKISLSHSLHTSLFASDLKKQSIGYYNKK